MASEQHSNDQELDHYLSGKSRLSRAYREADGPRPDEGLDQFILTAAKRHAGVERRIAHSPFSRSWMIPTSLAAVVVLCVSLVALMTFSPGLNDDLTHDPPAGWGETISKGTPLTPRATDKPASPAPHVTSRAESTGASDSRPEGTPEPIPAHPAAPWPTATPADEVRAGVGAAPASPEDWLRIIAELRRRGADEAAARELAAFKRSYPDYPAEEQLRKLMQSTSP